MDIKKELAENQTVLLVIPSSEQYADLVVDTVKKLAGRSVCYVTLNKTFESLRELFRKKKVDIKDVVFIDAISKTFKAAPEQADNCYYCSSPGALTELSITISKFLTHKFEYLVFDSLTNLTIYQDRGPVTKFISDLVNKIKGSDTKAVIYALSLKEQEALIKETGMFVDKVVQLDKGK